MGDKSVRKGDHFAYYFAVSCVITSVTLVSCTPLQSKVAEVNAHQRLEQYREDLAGGFFETVIQEGEQIVAENDKVHPADIALYVLGEVYSNHEFAGMDLRLSKYYFEKLIENFPDSPLTAEAKVYINLYDTIAAKQRTVVTLQQKALLKEALEEQKKRSIPPAIPHKIVENGNFADAIRKNLRLLEKIGLKKPADRALYDLGLIFAHADNPEKDYRRSRQYFELLTENFPESELAEEAHIWLGLFATIEKMQQIDADIEQQKKNLLP